MFHTARYSDGLLNTLGGEFSKVGNALCHRIWADSGENLSLGFPTRFNTNRAVQPPRWLEA